MLMSRIVVWKNTDISYDFRSDTGGRLVAPVSDLRLDTLKELVKRLLIACKGKAIGISASNIHSSSTYWTLFSKSNGIAWLSITCSFCAYMRTCIALSLLSVLSLTWLKRTVCIRLNFGAWVFALFFLLNVLYPPFTCYRLLALHETWRIKQLKNCSEDKSDA